MWAGCSRRARTLFFDENVGTRVPRTLRRAGPRAVDYRYLSEEFQGEREPGDKVLDVHWLRLVGEREWLAITRDRLILGES